jgi:large repetitive protein
VSQPMVSVADGADGAAKNAKLKVTVQSSSASPSPSPSASPTPAPTLDPVPLFVSTGNTSSSVVQIPVGCVSSACQTNVGGGFVQPEGIAFDGSGNLKAVVDNLQAPTQLASDASGNIYIADNYYGLFEYKKGSPETAETNLPYIINGATSAVAIEHSNVYIAYNQTVEIAALSCIASGYGSSCFSNIGGGFFLPTGLAVDAGGDVYVADFANQTVYGVPPGCLSQSCVVTLTPGGLAGARRIAIQSPGSPAIRHVHE